MPNVSAQIHPGQPAKPLVSSHKAVNDLEPDKSQVLMGHDNDFCSIVDDDGYDAGVWLRGFDGPGALRARTYVGMTRARVALTVVGFGHIIHLINLACKEQEV